jgi:hypothetical protein
MKEKKISGLSKENRNFIIGIIGFITALIFIVWLGSTAFYW